MKEGATPNLLQTATNRACNLDIVRTCAGYAHPRQNLARRDDGGLGEHTKKRRRQRRVDWADNGHSPNQKEKKQEKQQKK